MPIEKDYSVIQNLINGGLKSEESSSSLKLKPPHATGQENYQ